MVVMNSKAKIETTCKKVFGRQYDKPKRWLDPKHSARSQTVVSLQSVWDKLLVAAQRVCAAYRYPHPNFLYEEVHHHLIRQLFQHWRSFFETWLQWIQSFNNRKVLKEEPGYINSGWDTWELLIYKRSGAKLKHWFNQKRRLLLA